MPNRLAEEHSPYLLQHKDNPVDWYPWGTEAFDRARREDKPIFLSIGYSTCHWCHVMEHESFESRQVADVLNREFIPIKVDREERPDVDRVYMTFVQATTGSGGWPMSVWLTPSLQPFYGGTYFPPSSKWGRPGFIDILKEIARAWEEDRARIETSAESITERLRELGQNGARRSVPDTRALDEGVRQFAAAFDGRRGGFGDAPKFPRPSELLFLLREYARRDGRLDGREGLEGLEGREGRDGREGERRKGMHVEASDIELGAFGGRCVVHVSDRARRDRLGELRLPIPGRHNLQNALSAVAVADRLGIPFSKVASALADFHGAERRFERHGEAGGVLVVDDYGHHPTEIAAVLAAARATLGRRLVVAFQPHRFTRTQQLMDAFGPALREADEIVLTDIYAASEEPIPGVTLEALADAVRRGSGRPVHVVKHLDEIVAEVLKIVRPGDAVLTLGAGSIGLLPQRLIEALNGADLKVGPYVDGRRNG